MSEQPSRVITVLDHVLRGPHRRAAAHAIRASHHSKYLPHCAAGEFLELVVVDMSEPGAVALKDVLFNRLVKAVSPDATEDDAHVDVLTEEWWPDVYVLVEDDGQVSLKAVSVPSEAQRFEESSSALTQERARRVQLKADRDMTVSHVVELVEELRAIVQGYVPKGLDKHKELMDLARKAEMDVSKWIPSAD